MWDPSKRKTRHQAIDRIKRGRQSYRGQVNSFHTVYTTHMPLCAVSQSSSAVVSAPPTLFGFSLANESHLLQVIAQGKGMPANHQPPMGLSRLTDF